MENIRVFLSEKIQFLEVRFSIYLNRRVFVMKKYNVYPCKPHFYNIKVGFKGVKII